MKKILNFLSKFTWQDDGFSSGKKDIETVAQNTLRDYKKTFIDLARYDRDERISDPVSR